MGSFNIGLTGLNAATADLNVTGSNIANAETIGFKKSRAEFADVFAQSYCYINRTATGSGVRLAATPQQFSQGSLQYTDNGLDMAINGQGFFVLNGTDGPVYTRAGEFQVNRDGYVVNSQGQYLQAYTPKTPDAAVTEFNVGQMSNLQIPMGDSPPVTTTAVNSEINLVTNAKPPLDDTGTALLTFDPSDSATYNYSSSVTVYDSLGAPHSMTMYFVQDIDTATTPASAKPLTWQVYTAMDGTQSSGPTAMEFNVDGTIKTPTSLAVTLTPTPPATSPFANGGAIGKYDATTDSYDNTINIDFADMTEYGTTYSVGDMSQDGFAAGQLTGVDVDANGVLFTRYSSGRSIAQGQVALANFQNPQGLQVLGDNAWGETYGSGQAVYDAPGAGELGTVQSGALEMSNVDLTEELVHLIQAQRYFQANSQTISTADQMTQTILNLK